MSKGLFRLLVAALIAVLPLNGHIAAGQETVIDAFGRTVSAKEGRALRNRISDLERTSGLQATTIAGVAKRLGLQYKGLSETQLFRRLEAQIGEAVQLRGRIEELEKRVAVLGDPATRDPAQTLLSQAQAAFVQGAFDIAEAKLRALSELRGMESVTAFAAWLEAKRSEAQAAEVQGGEEDFDRADNIRGEIAATLIEREKRSKRKRIDVQIERATSRVRQAQSFADRRAAERAQQILIVEVLPLINGDEYLRDQAAAANITGTTLALFAEMGPVADRKSLLEQSVAKYDNAFGIYQALDDTNNLLTVGGNKTSILRKIAEIRVGSERLATLEQAIGFSRQLAEIALEHKSRVFAFQNSNRLGTLMIMVADEHDDPVRKREILDNAIEVMDGGIAMVDEQRTDHHELGSLYVNRATAELERSRLVEGTHKNTSIGKAIASYWAGLNHVSREDKPVLWAVAQDGLGRSYTALARLKSGDELERLFLKSFQAYQRSLAVRSRDDLPFEWFKTMSNYGLALSNYANRQKGLKRLRYFRLAEDVFEQTSDFADPDIMPERHRDQVRLLEKVRTALNPLQSNTGS